MSQLLTDPREKNSAGGGTGLVEPLCDVGFVADGFPHYGEAYDQVRVRCHRGGRPEPARPYRALIAEYDGIPEAEKHYAEGAVDALFTLSEAQAVRDYVAATRGVESTIDEQQLPIPPDLATRDKFPLEDRHEGILDLWEEEGYSLDFQVWAFYDVEGCALTAGPYRERGTRCVRRTFSRLDLGSEVPVEKLGAAVGQLLAREPGYAVESNERFLDELSERTTIAAAYL